MLAIDAGSGKGHAGARGGRHGCRRTRHTADEQALDVLLVLAEVTGVADAHRETVAALDGGCDDLAAQRHLDGVLDVADRQAVAGRLRPVDLDFQIAFAHDRLGDHVLGPLDRLEGLLNFLAHAVDGRQVRPEDAHADLRLDAGAEHVDAVRDRLRPDVDPAGHVDDRVQLLLQIALGAARAPPQE